MRAAVFFLRIPRFIALSIALYADGRSFSAPAMSFLKIAAEKVFVESRKADFLRILKIRFLAEDRIAFFAELVIAICIMYVIRYLPRKGKW